MQPSRQKRQWQAQWQSRPGSSTDHRETKRRLHGSCLWRDNQEIDAWPPRSTSPLQPRRHANSTPTPPWRDRVYRPESQAHGGARWLPSEADEHTPRRQPPVRRSRSQEPPLTRRRSELDSSSVSRSWAQRHQDPYPLRAPRSLNVSRLGDGHAPDPVMYEQWDSEVAQDACSNQPRWDDDDDNAEDDAEEEDTDEQSNFTLKHRYSPPARSYERRQNVRGDHPLQRTHGPIRWLHVENVGVLHNQVPSWDAHRQSSRRVELPARRWSQSHKSLPESPSETSQARTSQSLTTNSVDVQSYPMRPTRQEMVETGKSATSMVRRPPHAFEAGQAQSLVDKHDELFDNGDGIGSENKAQSTSKRRLSALGKRKATLTRDGGIVDCGSEPREELVAVKPKVSGSEGGIAKPRSHGTRNRRQKQCQYPEGCDKCARGSTMFCKAHGGGKRCQYPDGCDKSARDSTMFCAAHGGGKRCQYPEGCDKCAQGATLFCLAHGGGKRCQYREGCSKSALGATMFCAAHGGGKRCQYPEGCDKGAQRSTMFCVAHGGGKRCQHPEGCEKGAEGSTMFCKAHGGGKRCQYPEGCGSGARGSTMFCKAHGGGKRCQFPEGCGKSAIGRTLFCIAHGGGKRCQYPEGCSKGAHGSTMFCIAHGGGRRCQYPEGCGKGAQGGTLLCAAHGGGRRCGHESGCRKLVQRAGLCKRHGADEGV